MFGPHLTIDLYGCDKEKLNDIQHIRQILDQMPGKLGLNKFSEPQITKIPDRENSFDRGGLTGFVIIVESHISVHTFPEEKFASFDIFSFKEFDTEYACNELMKLLGAEKSEKNFIIRGKEFVKHYPRNMQKATEIAHNERDSLVKAKTA